MSPPTFPHDGLVGFAGLSQSAINETSWFQHICDHGLVDDCRFGLAYKADNTGVQYFGYVDETRFKGPLSVAPVVPNQEWASWMDIVYNGKVIEEDAWMVTDSGTTIIFGLVAYCFLIHQKSLFHTNSATTGLLSRFRTSLILQVSNPCWLRGRPQPSPATSAAPTHQL